MAQVDIKSVKEYLLAALDEAQKNPATALKGSRLTKRDEALLLVAGNAMKAMEADYLATLNTVMTIAQNDRMALQVLQTGINMITPPNP